MGRPVLAKDEARGVLIGARFSPTEAKRVNDAVKRNQSTKSEWIRATLLSAAENV